GAVETLCQDGCQVKERDRVYPKYGGRIGDMKLRGFKRTYIGRVRLIQQHGEFAEHGARLRHPGDLNAFLYDRDRALLKDQQPAGCRGGAEHVPPARYVISGRVASFLWKNGHIGNQGRRHDRSSVALAAVVRLVSILTKGSALPCPGVGSPSILPLEEIRTAGHGPINRLRPNYHFRRFVKR